MVHVIAITTESETIEGLFCCAPCAREVCTQDPRVAWWEVFDEVGHMLDSSDKLNEEIERCECEKKVKQTRRK